MHQTDETRRAVLLLNEGDALLVAYLTGPICAHLCNSKPSSYNVVLGCAANLLLSVHLQHGEER